MGPPSRPPSFASPVGLSLVLAGPGEKCRATKLDPFEGVPPFPGRNKSGHGSDVARLSLLSHVGSCVVNPDRGSGAESRGMCNQRHTHACSPPVQCQIGIPRRHRKHTAERGKDPSCHS